MFPTEGFSPWTLCILCVLCGKKTLCPLWEKKLSAGKNLKKGVNYVNTDIQSDYRATKIN
jgi:hypothetical protein